MVNQVINASFTETYDINTAVGELSILGIHTPQAKNLKTQFKGFFQQYKKVKIHSCDIALACASTQALDPTQLGVSSGAMDPRDVMNPILFKACTGEKMNVLLDKIYSETSSATGTNDGSLRQVFETSQNGLKAYYSLLSEDGFRKVHPQNGLTVMGLKPLVRKIVTTGEFKNAGMLIEQENTNASRPSMSGDNQSLGWGSPAIAANGGSTIIRNTIMTNGTTDMPAMDTTYETTESTEYVAGSAISSQNVTKQFLINNIPRIYMGVIVLPPAITQRLFFRMSIRWHISFYEYRPSIDLAPLDGYVGIETVNGMNENRNWGYYEMYHNAVPTAKEMNKDYSSFSTTETSEVTKILEKSA